MLTYTSGLIKMNKVLLVFLFIDLLCQFSSLFVELDSISQSQSLSHGSTLVSGDGTFELGFFSPGNSGKYYLGIWYKKIPAKTYVWVANRISPINDTSGVLSVNDSGNLVLLRKNETVVWSTNITNPARSPIVHLLDTGNLVLRDGQDSNSDDYLWQSFDYPTDTVLAEMKIGWDKRTGINRHLTAWRSPDNPSPGDFSWGLEHYNFPEAAAYKGNQKYFSSGPWNGLRYSGAPEQKSNPIFRFSFVNNVDEVYYAYYPMSKSVLTRTVLNQTTCVWERYTWSEATDDWKLLFSVPKDHCDYYGLCGAYGNCNMNDMPVCQCLHGFVPKSPDKWAASDWSQGCVRAKPMECGDKQGFVKFTGLKLPDTEFSWVNASFSLTECRDKCLTNCSCMAYAPYDIRGKGSGCAIWFGDLMDIRSFPVGGQDLFVRMLASELGVDSRPEVKVAVAVACSIAVIFLIVLAGCYMSISRVKFNAVSEKNVEHTEKEWNNETSKEDLELPIFDLATIAKATKNFSLDNKLGEGGFGPVFKGKLVDGREIAVKSLSASSGQGLKEFKNEVILIAKLQHRNLVKLLGCCIQGKEKMLIYEYMRNRSLDAFIFDNKKCNLLDWPKRFNIICGVARGLLYLHQDSRLRIIHRDLKASNILLDNDMNPKISDFGMARTFGGDQCEGNTNRVVGTYGYMAPEYAIDGLFSVKSDVFSFGILLLEIISGKRNRGLFHLNQNLIGHAWRLQMEGRPLELIDERLQNDCALYEVMRCIHVGFLCLQHLPEDRPTMASVAVMLGSETELPPPKQPGYFIDKNPYEGNTSSSQHGSHSVNEITVTLIKGR